MASSIFGSDNIPITLNAPLCFIWTHISNGESYSIPEHLQIDQTMHI